MRALFPGSFDPVTHGHLDLIARLAGLVDEVVVAIAINPVKRPLFSEAERVELLTTVCRPWPAVRGVVLRPPIKKMERFFLPEAVRSARYGI